LLTTRKKANGIVYLYDGRVSLLVESSGGPQHEEMEGLREGEGAEKPQKQAIQKRDEQRKGRKERGRTGTGVKNDPLSLTRTGRKREPTLRLLLEKKLGKGQKTGKNSESKGIQNINCSSRYS
jgi:hypothetical protein